MDLFSDALEINKQEEETDISAEEFSFSDEMAEEQEEVNQILAIGDFDDEDFSGDPSFRANAESDNQQSVDENVQNTDLEQKKEDDNQTTEKELKEN